MVITLIRFSGHSFLVLCRVAGGFTERINGLKRKQEILRVLVIELVDWIMFITNYR